MGLALAVPVPSALVLLGRHLSQAPAAAVSTGAEVESVVLCQLPAAGAALSPVAAGMCSAMGVRVGVAPAG